MAEVSSTVDTCGRQRCQLCLAIARPVEEAELCPDGVYGIIFSNASEEAAGNEGMSSTQHAATWRPKWLQPVVLSTFIALFLCFAAILVVVLYMSERDNGLLKTRPGFAYVGRFGPSAGKAFYKI